MVAQRSTPHRGVADESTIQPLEALSLQDLLETTYQPLEWVIPDILPEGLTLFFAGAKVGKSMVALALMLRMIRHVMGLGTVAGDVLYLSMDDRSKRRLQSRIRSLLGGTMIEDSANQAHFVFRAEALNTGLMTQLDWWMRGHQNTKLIIVDVYAAIKPKAGDDIFSSDYKALEDLRDFAEQRHIAILLLHHTRKRKGATEEDWTLDVNGSMGLLGACDTLWKIERPRGSNVMVLRAKGRDVEETALCVDLDELDEEWKIIEEDQEGDTQSVASVAEQNIVDMFATVATLSPKVVCAQTGMKPGTVRKALRRLLAKGFVEQSAYGSYSKVSVATCESVAKDTPQNVPHLPHFATVATLSPPPPADEDVPPPEYPGEDEIAPPAEEPAPLPSPHPVTKECQGRCIRVNVAPAFTEPCPVCAGKVWGQTFRQGRTIYYCRKCHPEMTKRAGMGYHA